MISPTDLLHPSPTPHFKTFHVVLIYCPKFTTKKKHNFIFLPLTKKVNSAIPKRNCQGAKKTSEGIRYFIWQINKIVITRTQKMS
jgi:hypothetical protein